MEDMGVTAVMEVTVDMEAMAAMEEEDMGDVSYMINSPPDLDFVFILTSIFCPSTKDGGCKPIRSHYQFSVTTHY